HNQDRNAHRDELRPLLVERLRTRTRDEWFETLLAAGVACGPINTVAEGVAFAERLGLDPVVRLGEDAVPSIRNPLTFSATPPRYDLPPPELDEHGEQLRAWLSGPRTPILESEGG
ncbi:MAG: CoA transferase, partial [Nocardioidaceae bacterium]